MTLLLSDARFSRRKSFARVGLAPLAPLASSLAADLERVIAHPLYVPETKAMLSREGGRCAKDGTMLDFDPFSPRSHRCPTCGTAYTGELHDRFWDYWYQLWLAERAVHGALLGALDVLPRGVEFACRVLDAYCDLYPRYPNVDNALGPSQPFFSTYLESIWLLQLCVAADLLSREATAKATIDRLRDSVIEPSAALIASYDEGMSNRQVWNNAALMAAFRLLGRDEQAEAVVWTASGLVTHLSNALLPDGTWYEGENYHLFAHRGLWYSMQMCESAGFDVPPEFVARYDRGFVTPFLTSLPDLTFPSRRDSQYAVPFRQWRFAEMCELGLARRPDRVLAGMLARLYSGDTPRRDTGRWKSSAEAERNLPASSLTRADLGWKSLLLANEDVSASESGALGSVLLEAQGIGVLRRDNDRVYIGLDYGLSGGGHGHPDRLNLLLMNGDRRILDDMGTGSYVDPSLHWYRSTLAHNAPLLDGRSQPRVDGELTAFEDRGGAGWISASAPIAADAGAVRTVVAMPDYLLDEVSWSAPSPRTFDLPIHTDASVVRGGEPGKGSLNGSDALEDGFRFLKNVVHVSAVPASTTLQLHADDAELWIAADTSIDIWRATSYGPPGSAEKPFLVLRAKAATGCIRSVWSWKGSVRSAELFPKPVVMTAEARHEHSSVDHGWQVAIHVGAAKSTIDLQGLVKGAADDSHVHRVSSEWRRERPSREVTLLRNATHRVILEEDAYRRSEESWQEAGEPRAVVVFANRGGGTLGISVDVEAARTFVPPGTANRLDNEHADINGAGVQLYLATDEKTAGYVIVPIEGSKELQVRPIDGWGANVPVQGTWTATKHGFRIDLQAPVGVGQVLVDVIVNEKPAGRERRRGQLVMSGGGDFAYLRGDRHDASRLIPLVLIDE